MFLQRNIRRSKRHQNSHAARLAAANGCVAPPGLPLPNSSGGSPPANPSPPQLLDAAARPATEHYVNEDRTECKFDANSYQMVFVVNKEQYLYVRDSLEKARKVSESLLCYIVQFSFTSQIFSFIYYKHCSFKMLFL